MSMLDDIKDDINDLQTMHMIATSFTDTAAMRIRTIRKAFETNQQFYTELSHVYHLVKVVAQKRGLIPSKQSDAKTLRVAYTSNEHFYGNIHRRIMETILKETEKYKTDLLLIGNTSKEFMTVSALDQPFDFLKFAKDVPTKEEMEIFVEKMKPYTSVLVYYPHFVSLMRQDVGLIDVSHVLEFGEEKTQESETYILFEPEVDQILAFFERQIRSILFSRVVLESDLARTAARMVSMNEASERAQEMMKEKHSEFLKVMRSFINRQLLDTFSGRALWKSK